MECWHCGKPLDVAKIGFRTLCDACGSYLHCCKNCLYYKPGLPNDCMIPGTDLISDREKGNFCEEFKAKGKGPESTKSGKEISKKLFGEEDEPPKKSFNDLWGSDV